MGDLVFKGSWVETLGTDLMMEISSAEVDGGANYDFPSTMEKEKVFTSRRRLIMTRCIAHE